MKKLLSLILAVMLCLSIGVVAFAEETAADGESASDELTIKHVYIYTNNMLVIEFSEAVAEPKQTTAGDNFVQFFWGWYQNDGNSDNLYNEYFWVNHLQPAGCVISKLTDTAWLVQMYGDAIWPNDYFWGYYNDETNERHGNYGVGVIEFGSMTADGYVDSITSKDGTKKLKAEAYPAMALPDNQGSVAADVECAFYRENITYENDIVDKLMASQPAEETTVSDMTEPKVDDTTKADETTKADDTTKAEDDKTTEDKGANIPLIAGIAAAVVVIVVVVIVIVKKKK